MVAEIFHVDHEQFAGQYLWLWHLINKKSKPFYCISFIPGPPHDFPLDEFRASFGRLKRLLVKKYFMLLTSSVFYRENVQDGNLGDKGLQSCLETTVGRHFAIFRCFYYTHHKN